MITPTVRTARVTVKGQVTIPKAVREQLEIRDGDAVALEVTDGVAILRRVRPIDLRDFFGLLAEGPPAEGPPFAGRARERAAARRHVAARLSTPGRRPGRGEHRG